MFAINFNFPYRKKDGSLITMEKALDGAGADLDLVDLDDVAITTPADGDGLVYDPTTQKWKNSHEELSAIENVYGSKNLCEVEKSTASASEITLSNTGFAATSALGASYPFVRLNTSHLENGKNYIVSFTVDSLSGSDAKSITLRNESNVVQKKVDITTTGEYEMTFTYTTGYRLDLFLGFISPTVDSDALTISSLMIRDSRIKDSTYVPHAMTNRELTAGFGNVKEIQAGRFSYTNGASIEGSVTFDKPFTKGTTTVVIIIGESGNTQYITLFTVHGASASGFSYIGKNVTGDTTSTERYAQYIAMRY